MRYCDRCGAAIVSGGHKSCSSGLWGSPFVCDECFEKEVEAGKAAAGIGLFFVRIFIGILVGLGAILAMCKGVEFTCGGLSNAVTNRILIGMEGVAIICFIISKVGTYKLQNRFAKFILRIVAYFTFWMSLVYGVALYFIIKYEGL